MNYKILALWCTELRERKMNYLANFYTELGKKVNYKNLTNRAQVEEEAYKIMANK
jgi:hypothetical protein